MLRRTALTFAFIATAAHADDCQPLLDAAAKTAATPNHQYITTVSAARNGGQPSQSEVITTAGRRYIRVNGHWTSRAFDAKAAAAEIAANAQDTARTCQFERDDTVDGQPAAVYRETTDETSGEAWIAKANGLILKQSTTIDVGGKLGQSRTDVRFDYHDVAAPAP